MRCLYCGKELALLKRWTGGGEFCSDVHRQRYQEEYNQLALNRLLQAKPPAKPEKPIPEKPVPEKPVPEKPVDEAPAARPVTEVAKVESARQATAHVAPTPAARLPEPASLKISESPGARPTFREIPAAAPVKTAPVISEPPVVTPPVEQQKLAEVAAPAEAAGFFVEMPVAVLADVAPMSRPGMEFIDAVAAALPDHSFEPLNAQRKTYQLETAGLLTFQPSNRASNYTANGTRERRLEVRDFVRTTPIVEIDLSPAGETGLETSSEAMDILMFPQPPQGQPNLWQEPPLRFSGAGTELGDLARLAFPTTGFSDQEEPAESQNHAFTAEEPPAVEVVPAPQAEVVVAEPVVEAILEIPAVPEPVLIETAVRETAVRETAVIETAVPETAVPEATEETAPESVQEVVPAIESKEQVHQPAPLPEPITRPLPLTLHASAPAKGKAVQVFSSASNAVNVQVPRSSSLPLRATMTFGPAPVKNDVKNDVKADAKAESKKPVPAPAAARPVPEVKKPVLKTTVPEPVKQVAKAETSGPQKQPAKVDAKQDKKPEVKENVKLKEEAKPQKTETPLPAPLAAPYPGSTDLGLPRLNLQSSPGFLGQIPMLVKIGIVVVLVAGLGGLIAFSSKSGGAATVSNRPGTVVVGSALPSGDAGWIADWGAEQGVRRSRQISILRSSQTLTDYRIEMQGQIDTKAIGWIFRAADPKHYYVTKLEIVKPGLEPTIALVRFAIIDGEEQVHAQLPLPMKFRRDTLFKIRLDAVGNHFTTYVQDEKVDDWTDDRVKTGGVGLYSERGEAATLKGGMSVVPLVIRK
jgi:hypothetical protein